MQIQDLTTEHFHALHQLNQAALPHVNDLSFEDFSVLSHGCDYRRGVFVDQQPVAFVYALPPGLHYNSENYRWFNKKLENFYYIDRIVVDPSAHGQGVGRALYTDLAHYAQGFDSLCCEVNLRPPNPGSMQFHQRCGFEQIGTLGRQDESKQVAMLQKSLYLSIPKG